MGVGSSSLPGTTAIMGDWLSRLEHRLCKPGVVGSSPTSSTLAPDWGDGSLTGCGRSRRAWGRSPCVPSRDKYRRERDEKTRETACAHGARTRRERAGPRPIPQGCGGAASEWRRAHGGCLWLTEATKGAAGRERPRGGASSPGSADARMGKPAAREARHPPYGGGEPGEPKHPSSRRKGKQQ